MISVKPPSSAIIDIDDKFHLNQKNGPLIHNDLCYTAFKGMRAGWQGINRLKLDPARVSGWAFGVGAMGAAAAGVLSGAAIPIILGGAIGAVMGGIGGLCFSNGNKIDETQERPLTPQRVLRENRVRTGSHLIQKKLEKEFRMAQEQMALERDKAFKYVEGVYFGGCLEGQIDQYPTGVCHYTGLRKEMEDEHIAVSFPLRIKDKDFPVQLFGIFDGHGGHYAARFIERNLQNKLQQTLTEFNPDHLTDEGIWNALKLTFVRLNQEFPLSLSGTTATVAMILDGKLWTANVGDSRTILDCNGTTVRLSEDAKPSDKRYQRGIRNRGGEVYRNGGMRVGGVLAVARAVGDHSVEGVSARPKITAIQMSDIPAGSHLVLCCDGVYDVASSRQIGDSVHKHQHKSPAELAQGIVTSAFLAGSQDNLSALVVKLP